ncbi:M20 family metallopeptidase [Haloactinomyces albus]|uniref:Peptidase M20 domain-containing protein 2 n=1 Tax=Haloactinomyces albus TaxID=1352928 RepID=A0AAE4CMN6_9ACTN|nr:M20 family metallopeptidase [Haloactinomyces albus]MDR7303595.1 amidohydrolase [Haloactinomyces albus]
MNIHDAIDSAVSSAESEVVGLSHRVHAHPELAWEEERSSQWVAAALDDLGYDVQHGICGLPTALRGRIGSGPLHIGICAEYDALPELGHACGHNMIAASAVGAAAGLARVADDAGLTVSIVGTPAEEGGGGKITLLERGAFNGLHAAMMVHPGPVDVAEAAPFAVSHSAIRYRGKAAHAAAYPEHGVNAADAFTVAQVAIGLLRQHLPNTTRVHGVQTRGGEAPNAIPETTEGRWYVRANNLDELAEVEPRVLRCFEAGAHATGCELEIEAESAPYSEFHNDLDVLAAYRRNAEARGRRFSDEDASSRMNTASTDMGNVSRVLPAIHPYIGIDSLPAVNHQKEFAAHCITPAADRAVLDAATAMAQTAVDVAADPALVERLTL